MPALTLASTEETVEGLLGRQLEDGLVVHGGGVRVGDVSRCCRPTSARVMAEPAKANNTGAVNRPRRAMRPTRAWPRWARGKCDGEGFDLDGPNGHSQAVRSTLSVLQHRFC